MRRISPALLGLALASAPAQAAGSATLRLTAIIPVSCEIGLVGAQMTGRRLVLEVRRECNTAHSILVAAAHDSALGEVTVRYNETEVAMHADVESIAQPEAYYDGVDHIVIDAASGTPEDLRRYAASLNIAIDTA